MRGSFHRAAATALLLFPPFISSLPLAFHVASMTSSRSSLDSRNDIEEEWDVIVVGSGVGGLCAASLCAARYGFRTICLESHDVPGGCAHSFHRTTARRRPFCFDSGPSLLAGMSDKGTNPLRQVLDAVGTAEEIQWVNYDGWMIHDTAFPSEDPRSKFKFTAGSSDTFGTAWKKKAGQQSYQEFTKFRNRVMGQDLNGDTHELGLSQRSALIPPFALRGDMGVLFTLAPYLGKFLTIGLQGTLLTGPFSESMDLFGLKDEFSRKWFDYLAFALSGLDAAHTQAAPVLYTIMDMHKEGAQLDYPKGGMNSLIHALVKGLTKKGISNGELRLKSNVERFLLEEKNQRPICTGVVLENGNILKARRGVICNASLWNLAKLLEESLVNPLDISVAVAVNQIRLQANQMEMTGSFMHLHLGIPSTGLPADLEGHHSILSFDKEVTAEQNLVIVSIPSVFDSSLAPEGYHVVHAYTAASENFTDWETMLERGSDDGKTKGNDYKRTKKYLELKERKIEALWVALERVIPDIRERANREGSLVEVGTPLTHRRFNRRYRGTYGPAPSNGKSVWDLSGSKTPIDGLLTCGDTTFPGIGLPGVAASGTIAANTLADVSAQMRTMKELKELGALQ